MDGPPAHGRDKSGPIGVKIRNAKMGSMDVPRAAPRAGASPAPTIDEWASCACMGGATLAVALEGGRGQF